MTNSSSPTSSHASTLAAAPVNGNQDRSRPPLLSLFFAFQIIGGHIGFPIMLAVVFALRNASSRHPLFINFCVTWIVSSVVFCILFYTGYDTGPEPPFMICAIQASLVYAMPIMSSVSLSALVFHLWLCLKGAMTQTNTTRLKRIQWGLIALPYLVAIPYIVVPASIAYTMPDRVARRNRGFGFHCTTHSKLLRTAVSISVAISLVLLLVWEFLVARICYKNWRSVRAVTVYGWTSANLLARIAIFTLYACLGVAVCVIAIVFPSNRFRILFQASLPTAAFLLFASRPNLWRRTTDAPTSMRFDESPVNSFNPRAPPSNPFSPVQNSPLSRQESTFSSAQSSTKTLVAATQPHSYSTDMDKKYQVERGSAKHNASPVADRAFSNRGVPALPFQTSRQTVPRDVGPEGTIHEPEPELEGIMWTIPPQRATTWEGVRGPHADEKVIQETETYDVADTKPSRGRPAGRI